MKGVKREKKRNLGWMFIVVFLVSGLLGLAIISPSYGNNIQVTNGALTGQNASLDYTYVQFDLSWDNSWRTNNLDGDGTPDELGETNWDAAWVFVKYKKQGETTWNHAYLNTTAVNHTISAGYTCSVGTTGGNGMGVFIYRSSNGSGTASLTNVQLRWEYGDNGLSDDDTVTVKVFAIEMVYIPVVSFYAGDGETSNIRGQFESGTSGIALQITSEGELTLGGGGAGSLGNNNASGMRTADDFNDSNSQTLPAAFPKGYNDFYCMKYEISQGQYADFLNTLTTTQDSIRYYSGATYRYTIGGSAGSRSASVPDRACNWLRMVQHTQIGLACVL